MPVPREGRDQTIASWRMVGVCKTELGDSITPLLGALAAVGSASSTGTFVTSLAELRQRLTEMATTGEATWVDGPATRGNDHDPGANQKVIYDAKGTPLRAACCSESVTSSGPPPR
jgi:hypothetical protein